MSISWAVPRIVNAMTIDVEEHFHASIFNGAVSKESWHQMESRVCANTERLLRLLADVNVKASFFVLGCVAERHRDLVKRIAALGHEVASHGYGHELVYDQTPSAFREDAKRSKGLLESLTGIEVQGYRAPNYSITKRSLWALDILVDEGYRYDSSIFPVHHDRYGIPDAPRHPYTIDCSGRALLEVPPSTVRFGSINLPVAGGGYFRLFPYAFTRWGIARLNDVEHKPAFFYVHPWELDHDQPRLPLGRVDGMRHYNNLHKTEFRLKRLVADFRFAPLSTVLAGRLD